MLRVAALFVFYTALVHVFAGQRRVASPIEASNAPLFARSTSFVVWHMTSFLLVTIAAVVGFYGERLEPAFRLFLAAQAAFATLLFLVRAQRAHGGGFMLPQWILLGPSALAIAAPSFAAPLVLLALAVVHVGWLSGIAWPSPSMKSAPAFVIGRPEGAPMPSAAATIVVALALGAMAWAVWRGPKPAALAVAAVLGARGSFGLFERWLRPSIAKTPYRLLSAAFYSPLCLFLAMLIVLGR